MKRVLILILAIMLIASLPIQSMASSKFTTQRTYFPDNGTTQHLSLNCPSNKDGVKLYVRIKNESSGKEHRIGMYRLQQGSNTDNYTGDDWGDSSHYNEEEFIWWGNSRTTDHSIRAYLRYLGLHMPQAL